MRVFKEQRRKFVGMLAVAALLSVAAAGPPAWATDTIDKVSIKVKSDLEAGDSREDIGVNDDSTVSVSVSSDKYEISEAKWASTGNGSVKIGDEPKIIVTLTPTDESEDYFKSTYTKKDVKVSGGEFISARKSGADLLVTLKVKPVKGNYDPPDDAYWKETALGRAVWEMKDGSSGNAFEVWLYRGTKTVHKVDKVRSKSVDLYPYMTEEGVYTFKVRTIPANDSDKYGKKSEWVESGEQVITARDVSDGSRQKGKNEESTYVDTKNSIPGGDGWYQREGDWYYQNNDGEAVRGEWLELGDTWYLFRADGKMVTGWHEQDGHRYYLSGSGAMMTGWVSLGGKWYYFNPEWSEEPIGAAAQGWNIIDGYTFYFGEDCSMQTGWVYQLNSWYYLNELEGGLQGAMLKGWIYRDGLYYYTDEYGVMQTGWVEVDGYWYYFYPEDGHKAVDTLINGFYVDEDGVYKEGE